MSAEDSLHTYICQEERERVLNMQKDKLLHETNLNAEHSDGNLRMNCTPVRPLLAVSFLTDERSSQMTVSAAYKSTDFLLNSEGRARASRRHGPPCSGFFSV